MSAYDSLPRSPAACTWSIVLAGGNGARLASITRRDGAVVPKQYCSLDGRRSLLEVTLVRSSGVVPLARTFAVVATYHRTWWRRELEGSEVTPLEQPANRGTAAGILLPLLHVCERDPGAIVTIFPSDHHVSHPAVFLAAVSRAVTAATRNPDRVFLLGVRIEAPEPDYGWVLPGPRLNGNFAVRSFVEKPTAEETGEQHRAGALVNTFVIVATVAALRALVAAALPELVARFSDAGVPHSQPESVARLYETLPTSDFSHAVLERSPDRLGLVPVSPCGWTDLGTPARVQACLTRQRRAGMGASTLPRPAVDLAAEPAPHDLRRPP